MAGGPTPIILNGNNSPWHQLARGISGSLTNWAETYSKYKIQQAAREEQNQDVQDYYNKLSPKEKSMLQLTTDENGLLRVEEAPEIWSAPILDKASGLYVQTSNYGNVKAQSGAKKTENKVTYYKNDKRVENVVVGGEYEKMLKEQGFTREETVKPKEEGKEITLYNKAGDQVKVASGSDNEEIYRNLGFGDVKYAKPSEPTTKPNFETFYEADGTPHTIDTTKKSPDPSWSEDKPAAIQEKYDIQTDMTMNEIKSRFIKKPKDDEYFKTNASLFNRHNTTNEIAYWNKNLGRKGQIVVEDLDDEGTIANVLLTSPEAVKAGWTVSSIKSVAEQKGITIKELLIDLGIIE